MTSELTVNEMLGSTSMGSTPTDWINFQTGNEAALNMHASSLRQKPSLSWPNPMRILSHVCSGDVTEGPYMRPITVCNAYLGKVQRIE